MYLETDPPPEVFGQGSILRVALQQQPSSIRRSNLADVEARVQAFADAVQNCEGAHHKGEGGGEPEWLVC